MADLDDALAVYEDALAEAHRRGSPFGFGAVKVFRAQTLVWRGDLVEAEAEARDALAAGEAWGGSARFSGHAAAFLADALMEQGRLDDAAAAIARAEQSEALPDSARLLYLRDSRIRSACCGATSPAASPIYSSRPPLRRGRKPQPGVHRVALTRRARAARAWPARRGPRAGGGGARASRTWGAPRALGAALRAAGLVEGGESGLACLDEAVQVLAESPAKLEHAKARPSWGGPAQGQPPHEAREQLRRAVELATVCGAAALAARAETELLATGARPRRVAAERRRHR